MADHQSAPCGADVYYTAPMRNDASADPRSTRQAPALSADLDALVDGVTVTLDSLWSICDDEGKKILTTQIDALVAFVPAIRAMEAKAAEYEGTEALLQQHELDNARLRTENARLQQGAARLNVLKRWLETHGTLSLYRERSVSNVVHVTLYRTSLHGFARSDGADLNAAIDAAIAAERGADDLTADEEASRRIAAGLPQSEASQIADAAALAEARRNMPGAVFPPDERGA
jgi:hypothetical protein